MNFKKKANRFQEQVNSSLIKQAEEDNWRLGDKEAIRDFWGFFRENQDISISNFGNILNMQVQRKDGKSGATIQLSSNGKWNFVNWED